MQPFLKQIKNKKILVIGDLFLDEYVLGSSSRISPEGPVPIVNVKSGFSVLGGAGNTSANISSLKSSPILIGAVGKDTVGEQIKDLAKQLKVKLNPIISQTPTIKKTRVLAQNQQLVRIDFEEKAAFASAQEAKKFSVIQAALKNVEAVVLSDYDKGFFSEELCQKIIQLCRKKNIPVTVDPRPQNRSFYKNCHYITPNWKEALALVEADPMPSTTDNVKKIAEKIRKQLKTSVVLTLGPDGLYFLSEDKKNSFFMPTEAREVFDVSGAGDTVVAVFSLGLSIGLKPKQALGIANKAAGAVVAKRGTASVTPADLLGYSDENQILSRENLRELSKTLKAQGKKVVTLNGSFDLLHSGHLYILKEAKAAGDVLILGLNSDKSVKKYKGKDRPIVSEKHRANMLLAIKYVDYIHIFDEEDPIKFLNAAKPDVHVNGSEYGADCIEAPTVKKNGGRIHIISRIPDLSTSELLDKIRSLS